MASKTLRLLEPATLLTLFIGATYYLEDLAAEAITELEAVVDDLKEMLTLLEREGAIEVEIVSA